MSTTTDAPKRETAVARTKTTYVVLSLDESGFYKTFATLEANSAPEAIRLSAKLAGTYVAVPERSFVPTKVTIETQTVVKVG